MPARRRAKPGTGSARPSAGATRSSWYLLIHQLPPQPLYLRAKIRQHLARVGAIPLKQSVYALPATADGLEDLQWIAQEARTGGGEAYVCRAEFLERETDALLQARSRSDRDAQYRGLLESLAGIGSASAARPGRDAAGDARARLEEIRRIDFFQAPKRAAVERKIAEVEMHASSKPGSPARVPASRLMGKTWVTRPGIKIDRIASAWFVRRFVDPKARFRFDAEGRAPRAGEVFFDVIGGDFTHEGERCTLETLIHRTGVRDRGALRIAEIVHDVDLKEDRFGRAEAAGVRQILAGLFDSTSDDAERLREGLQIFDRLHRSFQKPAAAEKRGRRPPKPAPKR